MSNIGVHFVVNNEVATMQSFIVLGIIPGTHYQTTFGFWLIVASSFFSLLCLPRVILALSNIRKQWVLRQIAHHIEHSI